MSRTGLRERKKLRMRQALIDAALDLFLAQGYEQTTVEQIADAVEISPRTLFRYFSGKEDLALSHTSELEEELTAALAERPPQEPPFAALANAFRVALRQLGQSSPENVERHLKTRRLMETTPALMGRAITRMARMETRLAALVAARQGVDPGTDQRPHIVVALVVSAARIGMECPSDEVGDMGELVARVESAFALIEDALRPGWDVAPPRAAGAVS
ncbi:TetR family transcriptional regulator [Microtetraspora sp. NBRC 13810]|uniref:TetR/AcrR family transcriptional regulator n=1 Tax=Microtetraspora sp. NBRC 13810 TaxID=3030990 RepID=UPI0024A4F7BB|nr:TetR/AcrR family transcriptional regulator [Microtetraspora sp. NBRC 13810]GLW05052.1 TetR family transcriptional regulator [Microtetraspora sp. NBRC 13810]